MSNADVVGSAFYKALLDKKLKKQFLFKDAIPRTEQERMSIRAMNVYGNSDYQEQGAVTGFLFLVEFNDETSNLIELKRSKTFNYSKYKPLDEEVLVEVDALVKAAVELLNVAYG